MKLQISTVGKTIANILQVGANLAAVCGLLAGIFAFIYPASVADYGSEVLKLMQQSGADVAAIKESSAQTADNTGMVADNTAKLAAAIPNWLTYAVGAFNINLTGKDGSQGFVYSNESLAKIDYASKYFIDGMFLDETQGFAMPNETALIWVDQNILKGLAFTEFRLCLTGTSALMPGTVFHERRVFKSAEASNQLGDMVSADVQLAPFADCD